MPSNRLDEQTLREVIGLLPDNLILIDREWKLLFVNRLEVGYEAEDVLGVHVLEIIAPHARDEYSEVLTRVFESGESASNTVELVGGEGEPEWYEGRMIPIVREGVVTAVAVFSRNITERMRQSDELELLRRLLPICAWCKKVRTSDGQWEELEAFLARAGHDNITHGMCPTCEQRVAAEAG